MATQTEWAAAGAPTEAYESRVMRANPLFLEDDEVRAGPSILFYAAFQERSETSA